MSSCSVSIDGRRISSIGRGLLILLGVAGGDGEKEAAWLAEKALNLRIFPDDESKMNFSVLDISGELMVVSQFTLLADCSKGRRPSFVNAASGDEAERLYGRFVEELSGSGLSVGMGEFGAMMEVALVNDGPVTVVIDTP